MSKTRMMSGLAVCSVLLACASVPVPREQLATADAAVEHAQSQGAGQHASLPLAQARDKLDQARAAVARGDHRQASRLAAEAQIDATLALVQASSSKSSQAVEALDQAIRALQQSLSSPTPVPAATPPAQ